MKVVLCVFLCVALVSAKSMESEQLRMLVEKLIEQERSLQARSGESATSEGDEFHPETTVFDGLGEAEEYPEMEFLPKGVFDNDFLHKPLKQNMMRKFKDDIEQSYTDGMDICSNVVKVMDTAVGEGSDAAGLGDALKENVMPTLMEHGEKWEKHMMDIIQMLIKGALAGTVEDERPEIGCHLGDKFAKADLVCMLNKAYATMMAVEWAIGEAYGAFWNEETEEYALAPCAQVWEYLNSIQWDPSQIDGAEAATKVKEMTMCSVKNFETTVNTLDPDSDKAIAAGSPRNMMPRLVRATALMALLGDEGYNFGMQIGTLEYILNMDPAQMPAKKNLKKSLKSVHHARVARNMGMKSMYAKMYN